MASIPAQNVTLAKFRQNEEQFLQEMMKKLGHMYVERVASLLKELPFGFEASRAMQVAEGLVLKGELLMSTARCDVKDKNKINDIGIDYSEILNVALLLIQSPVEKKTKPLEVDKQSRDLQYKNFIKIHPSLNKESKKVHKEQIIVVQNYEQMKSEILAFLKKFGSRAVIASVFFIGHGTKRGLRFHEHQPGNEVPLDTAIHDLQEIVKENHADMKQKGHAELPCKVELIFWAVFCPSTQPIRYSRFHSVSLYK